jgi:hypothetical protein
MDLGNLDVVVIHEHLTVLECYIVTIIAASYPWLDLTKWMDENPDRQ